MRILNACFAVGAVVIAATVVGCGPASNEIPVGRWVGEGAYADYEVTRLGESGKSQRARGARYETSLEITATSAFGHDARKFKIVSKRGRLYNVPEDTTKIEYTLIPFRALENGTRLYAIYAKDAPDGVKGDAAAATKLPEGAIASATAFPTPRGVVLQVRYGRPTGRDNGHWSDTFHFAAGEVIKTGAYVNVESDEGGKLIEVRWVEKLTPKR